MLNVDIYEIHKCGNKIYIWLALYGALDIIDTLNDGVPFT